MSISRENPQLRTIGAESYRKTLEAEGVRILVDVKKKHAAHAATGDVSISEMAANLEFQRADAVIVTGATTGDAPDLDLLRATREATRLPVVVGSGMTARDTTSLRAGRATSPAKTRLGVIREVTVGE